jgi:hypothetical protein
MVADIAPWRVLVISHGDGISEAATMKLRSGNVARILKEERKMKGRSM